MIIENISGKRSIAFYKKEQNTVYKRYQKGFPAMEIITPDTSTVSLVTLVGPDGQTYSASQTATFDYGGVTYSARRYNEVNTIADGIYYIRFTVDGITYYSEKFTISSSCASVSIEGTSNCDDIWLGADGFISKFYFESLDVVPIGFAEYIESEQNGNGEEDVFFKTRQSKYSVTVPGNPDLFDRLNYLSMYPVVTLDGYDVNPDSIIVSSDNPNSLEQLITIEFQLIGDIAEVDKCGCTTIVNENDPQDVECGDLTVAIDETQIGIDGKLYSDVTPPAGKDLQYARWYRGGQLIGGGGLLSNTDGDNIPVTLTEYGDYTFRIKFDGCIEKAVTYSYIDVCANYDLSIDSSGGVITGGVVNSPDAVTYSIQFPYGTELGTSLPYSATQSGKHYVTVTSPTCGSKTISLFVDTNKVAGAAHTVAIDSLGGEFIADVQGAVGTITYLWEFVDAEGNVTQIGTAERVTPIETGIYRLTATDQGNGVSTEKLYVAPSDIVSAPKFEQFSIANTNLVSGENFVNVTVAPLPNLSILGITETNERLTVMSDGGTLFISENATPQDYNWVSIDNVNNRLIFFDNHSPTTVINMWIK